MPDISRTVNQRPLWLDDKTKSIMDRAIAREPSLARLLMTYIVTGLIFMLLPGTFLGVWNLIKISSREAAESISPAWIQAHGHAQLFGWVGTFILGIGFYSIPKLRKLKPFALREDRKSTRLNSSHSQISYAVFCLKKKKKKNTLQILIKNNNIKQKNIIIKHTCNKQ